MGTRIRIDEEKQWKELSVKAFNQTWEVYLEGPFEDIQRLEKDYYMELNVEVIHKLPHNICGAKVTPFCATQYKMPKFIACAVFPHLYNQTNK